MSENPITQLSMEIRLVLEQKCREPLTNKEIYILLMEKFPFLKTVKEKDIAQYRKIVVPDYNKMLIEKQSKVLQAEVKIETDLEQEIIAEVEQLEEDGAEFLKKGKDKVDILKSHRFLLAETWNNYSGVRSTDDEKAKKEYVEQLLKILTQIKDLEGMEKSLLGSLGEVRKAEQAMTYEKYAEHIKMYDLLRMTEKCKTKDEVYATLDDIKNFIDEYKKIVEASENASAANMVALEKFYVTKKVYNEVKT